MIRSDRNEIIYPLIRGGFYILHTLYVNAKERRAVQYLFFTLLFSLRKKDLWFFLVFLVFAKNVDG